MEEKVCSECKETKSIEEFYINKSRGKLYLRGQCKECIRNPKNKTKPINKKCVRCKRKLLLEDFYKSRRSKCGVRSVCKNCHTLEKGECRSNWDTSDLTCDYYEKMLEKQNGQCAICGTTQPHSEKSNKRRFAVDHNHQTGKTRGLLCNRCNRGIGHFLDNPSFIFAAYEYIMKHDYSG